MCARTKQSFFSPLAGVNPASLLKLITAPPLLCYAPRWSCSAGVNPAGAPKASLQSLAGRESSKSRKPCGLGLCVFLDCHALQGKARNDAALSPRRF
ncbi:hypothetical protein [Helicobacter sp.]|uniref:hypothetical protein n=1 Tax=Helicobacter sp. TaxID=218 RepID=UPI00388E6A99